MLISKLLCVVALTERPETNIWKAKENTKNVVFLLLPGETLGESRETARLGLSMATVLEGTNALLTVQKTKRGGKQKDKGKGEGRGKGKKGRSRSRSNSQSSRGSGSSWSSSKSRKSSWSRRRSSSNNKRQICRDYVAGNALGAKTASGLILLFANTTKWTLQKGEELQVYAHWAWSSF